MTMRLHAFPTDEYFDEERVGQHPGMTLRDYFAAAAMQGLLAHKPFSTGAVAVAAYALADAMLVERAAVPVNRAPREHVQD